MNFHLFLAVILLLCVADLAKSVESDLTISIEPNKRECFHQYIEKGASFDVEYQVIDGGDLDISFVVTTPSGRLLVTEVKRVEGSHTITADEDGDYKFCLDNSFSRFSSKLVFFELMTDNIDLNWARLDQLQDYEDEFASTFEMKLEDFQDVLNVVHERLEKSQSYQRSLKTYESRDRSIAEDNFIRVNYWSCIQLGVMIVTGIAQVVLIRQLFAVKTFQMTPT